MTDRTITPEDLDGTSARGKAAYAARQATLRRMGIVPAAEERSVFDLDPEAEEAAAMDAFDRELKQIEQLDRAHQKELRDAGWIHDEKRQH